MLRRLKPLLILLFFILCNLCANAQRIWADQSALFFDRPPSTSVEAMGKINVVNNGDLASATFNPALLSGLRGFASHGTIASSILDFEKSNISFVGMAARIHKRFKLGLSQHAYRFEAGNSLVPDVKYISKRTNLTMASEFAKNWNAGLNFSLHQSKFNDNVEQGSLLLDFGILKEIKLGTKTDSFGLSFGSSIMNFGYSSTEKNVNYIHPDKLPVTLRVGIAFDYLVKAKTKSRQLYIFDTKFQFEYQDLLNALTYTAIRGGVQLRFLEMLSIRAGYYREVQPNNGSPPKLADVMGTLTYGLGLNLPLDKLIEVPFQVAMDYAHLPREAYINTPNDSSDFNSYTLKVNWLFGKKRM